MSEWRKVPGHPLYEVSDDGCVRRGKRPIKPYINTRTGYEEVRFCESNRTTHQAVHRLVALAFIPKPEGKNVINHKDYDKTNNRAENLEWLTVRENVLHSAIHMHGQRNTKPGKSGEKYIYIKRSGRYRVTIREKHVGTFKTLDEAKKARDRACDLLFSRSAGSIAIYAGDRRPTSTTYSAQL